MTRQQLPPQIRKVEILDRKTDRTVGRYQLTVDAGVNGETGRRQQLRRRYATEREARDALAEITSAAVQRHVTRWLKSPARPSKGT